MRIEASKNIARQLLTCSLVLLINLMIMWLFFSGNYDRDWSTRADQELTLAYNAVLINSGYRQEYFDHPGFVTIQSIALLMRTLYSYGNLAILTIGNLNESINLFDSFNQIVKASRYLSLIGTLILINISFIVIQTQLRNILATTAILIALFFSSSITEHFLYLRTELITFISLLASALFFTNIYRYSGRNLFINILLGCTFLFLSAINKSQVLLYFPIYFIWSLAIANLSENRNPKNLGLDMSLILAMGSMLLNLLFFIMMAKGLSKGFQFIYILSLNTTLYLFSKTKSNINQIMVFFNLNYLIAYCISALVVFAIGHNISLFFNIINSPLEMLKWAALNQANQENGGIEIGSIFWRLLAPLTYVVLKPDSQIVLLGFNLVLGIYLYKRLSTHLRFAFFVGLLAFYLCSIISSTRYWAPNYFIFSEFFLIANLVLLLKAIQTRRTQIFLAFTVALSVLSINLPTFSRDRISMGNARQEICNTPYLVESHHQINKELIFKECKSYGRDTK